MIETSHLRHAGPVGGVVTGLARRGETAPVRVSVTPCAPGEGKSRVLDVRLGVSNGGVAFLASNGRMRAREGKFCLGMAESRRRFPAVHGVELRAVRAQLPAMLIHMTTCAIAR